MLKLNIGGAKNREKIKQDSWTIVDCRQNADYVIDLNNAKLPFNNNSVDAVYTSHTIEHLLPHRLPYVFFEIHRIMKKDAKIRIVVPDIDIVIKAYINKDYEYLKKKENPRKLDCLPPLPICYLNGWFFTYDYSHEESITLNLGGHLIGFSQELLEYYLKISEFIHIVKKDFNNCSEIFKGLDFNRYINGSIFMEAEK